MRQGSCDRESRDGGRYFGRVTDEKMGRVGALPANGGASMKGGGWFFGSAVLWRL